MPNFRDMFRNYDNKEGKKSAQLKAKLDGGYKNPEWKEKYKTEHLTFPSDLFSSEKPLGAYVVFYINMFDASVAKNEKSKIEFVSDADNAKIQKQRRNGEIKNIAENRSSLAVGNVIGSVIAGTVVGSLLSIDKNMSYGAAWSGGVALAGIAALSAQGVTFTKSQKRLKEAIALPMPTDVQVAYEASYDTERLSATALSLKLGSKITENVVGNIADGTGYLINKTGDVLNSEGTQNIGANIANWGKKFSSVTFEDVAKTSTEAASAIALKVLPFGKAVSAASGLAVNPQQQVMFEGIKPRSFTMEYNLFPRNDDELKKIHRIVNTFKKNMLPEYKSDDRFLFIYPAEFDIEYYFGAEQNNYIHRHTSCVLTGCRVNYTPDGTFNHFNSNGAPTRVTLSLQFTELEVVTRDDINVEGGGY